MKFNVLFLISLFSLFQPQDGRIYQSVKGKIVFRSDAPLEMIEASSDLLKGAIDVEKRTFAFSVPIRSFQGFNNPLQRDHFNENYMESNSFPNAIFSGKIIENIDFSQKGTFSVRAKGELIIHGVTQERIIKSQIVIEESGFSIESNFTIILEEHKISVPKIVHQKIAEEIQVQVEATFEQKPNE